MSVVIGDRQLGPRNFGGRKAKQVLEILALENRLVSKDQLASSLWNDDAPQDVEGCLEHYVSLLRRQLRTGRAAGPAMIRTEPGGYRLDPEHVWVDVAAFDKIEVACAGSDDRSLVESALALMRGDLLEDEPFADWALHARNTYRERKLRLACAAGELALQERDFDAAVNWARAAAGIDTLNEASHRCLMLAHYARGERGAALRAFAGLNRALVDELGVDAMRTTATLHKAILDEVPVEELLPARRAPAVDVRPARTPQIADPGPGEFAYLGRQAQLNALAAACTPHRTGGGPVMVLVEGGSGIGRSRFLDEAAGRIAGSTVRTVRCAPGTHHVRGALMEQIVAALAEPKAETALHGKAFCGAVEADSVSLTAVRELERCLAGRGRFVVMIDDAHWADAFSIRLLSYLTERDQGIDGVFVVAVNDDEQWPEQSHLSVRAAHRIQLGPLSEADLEPLGMAGVHAATGGLPVDVVAHARVRAGVAADVPAAYRERVLARIRALGEDAWRVAVASAVADAPVAPDDLSAVLGADPLAVAEQQERLCAIGILQPVADGYAYRYPLARLLVRDALSPARLRLLDQQRRRPAASLEAHHQHLLPVRAPSGPAASTARANVSPLRPTRRSSAGIAGR